MLVDVINYSGIYAKTRALKAELLTHDDYVRLASCASVKDFIAVLGEKKAYKESAEEAIAYGTNRVSLERSLHKALYRDYMVISSFLSGSGEKKYIDIVFLRYEISYINRMLRRLYDQRDIRDVIPKTDKYLSGRLKIDAEKLGQCTTIDEFLEALKNTEFYDVLIKVNSDKGTLFDYEMQLEFYRFMKTYKYQDKYLDKRTRNTQRNITGSDADLLNIMWIHRAKTYYDIDNDRIFSYLIPVNHRLSIENVKALVASGDDKTFLDILSKTHYKNVFTSVSKDNMEKCYNAYMSELYSREERKSPFSLSSAIWLLYAKMREIKNITTLTECVRYNLASSISLKKISITL